MIEIFLFITGLVSLIGMYSLWFYLIETNKIKLPRHLDIYNKPGFKKETEDEQ
tara:strand:- start:622 stop:780 length:159 start_codon:yes stop_codon:yes gene_type:complete